MPRDSDVYLEDILTSIGRISDYTAGLTREAFLEDQKTVDAVARNLEIVGEAVNNIPAGASRRRGVQAPGERPRDRAHLGRRVRGQERGGRHRALA